MYLMEFFLVDINFVGLVFIKVLEVKLSLQVQKMNQFIVKFVLLTWIILITLVFFLIGQKGLSCGKWVKEGWKKDWLVVRDVWGNWLLSALILVYVIVLSVSWINSCLISALVGMLVKVMLIVMFVGVKLRLIIMNSFLFFVMDMFIVLIVWLVCWDNLLVGFVRVLWVFVIIEKCWKILWLNVWNARGNIVLIIFWVISAVRRNFVLFANQVKIILGVPSAKIDSHSKSQNIWKVWDSTSKSLIIRIALS